MSPTFLAESSTLIDLSIGLESGVASEPWPPEINGFDHEIGAEKLAENLRASGYDISADDFPNGMGLAWEEVASIPHAGTHLDAPWHYGPTSGDERSKTVDEVPLDWCVGEAVVLDFTWKEPRSEITPADVNHQLDELEYSLSGDEIVLLETGADDLWGTEEYLTEFPGMGAAATKLIVEQGVKVIGTDAYGFDKPFVEMGRRHQTSGDSSELWPAHFVGREIGYCQIEKMANLGSLPRRVGIPVVTFPVNIVGSSAAWVRPVAFLGPEV